MHVILDTANINHAGIVNDSQLISLSFSHENNFMIQQLNNCSIFPSRIDQP